MQALAGKRAPVSMYVMRMLYVHKKWQGIDSVLYAPLATCTQMVGLHLTITCQVSIIGLKLPAL
jgi:hypothetical protein